MQTELSEVSETDYPEEKINEEDESNPRPTKAKGKKERSEVY
jgi:hypothetical protein